MRVHQLAKEYDKKSSDFLTEIQGYGIDASSHLSGLNDDEVATIRQKIGIKEVAIKLENEVLVRQICNQAGKSEEHFATYSDEDRLEEEPKKDDWTLGSEDSVVEPPKVSIPSEEVQETVATNVKAAGDAREKYADTVKNITENQEDWHVVTPKKEDIELVEDTSSLVLEDLSVDVPDDIPEDVEEESKTEEFNGVEVDEQLNPVDEMEDGEEETDTELSFGQKAFAKAKVEEETEDVTEDWSSMKELARQDDDAEWTKKVLEADAKIAVQEVIVEKPTGFWSWLTGLFT